jgi:uncharacterized protein YndB with AHSA1/START domain
MAPESSTAATLEQRTLFIDRIFDAPRELVFRAWTDPEHIVHWWGPRGFKSTVLALDVRSGGAYRIHMRSPENTDHWSQGIFREVVPPERLVMVGSWADKDGNPTTPQTVATVTFEDRGGKTRLTLHQVFDTETARDAHRGGWNSSMDVLAEYLASV